jgi:hypothetical protein
MLLDPHEHNIAAYLAEAGSTAGTRGAWVGAFLSAVAFGRFSMVIGSPASQTGPEMPPSFRILQKWTIIRMAVINGNAITCMT